MNYSASDLKKRLLDHYGVDESFLNAEYKLADPFLFKDMKKAITRLKKAIDSEEHIGIYADYDCDGIPASIVLMDLFKKLGMADRVHVYIPDRHDEGYGVNENGLQSLVNQGVKLIITVDVGITAIAEIARFKEDVDIIVTDHHNIISSLPSAYAIIHPEIGEYPNKNACGCAVAFHLVRAFLEKHGGEYEIPEGFEKWSLDMVGFATLSDMVPLVGENRILVHFGMLVMKKTKRIGLQILFQKNNIPLQNLVESDLTFTVAPRLNAASRMASPILAFNLLSTDSESEAITIVNELEKINNERKILVARLVKSAHLSLEHRELPDIVVVGNPDWRPAVLGLVANKLQESYERSFFVWGEAGDGSIKGSCRMTSEHHASMLMGALPESLMIHAGGHQAAGGFSISKEKVHFLEEALNNALKNIGKNESTKKGSNLIELSVPAVNTQNLKTIRSFAPFGIGHDEPIFIFNNVEIRSFKKFGKNKEHLEFAVSDGVKEATAFTFFANEKLFEKISTSQNINFSGSLEAGWRGGVRVRLKDIH